MTFIAYKRSIAATAIALVMGVATSGCSSGGGNNDVSTNGRGNGGLAALTDRQINAPDGQLQATIRTTTGGVPHITADNLESAGFGEGYVQARDNVCIIADEILKATGTRARFFGPGANSANIINDFSYRALRLTERANEQFGQLSPVSQAMLRGFAAGYNKYVNETDPADLPGKCTNQPWVRPITAEQLYAYYQVIALFASGAQFATGATFSAVPPGEPVQPTSATPQQAAAVAKLDMPDFARLARNGIPADLNKPIDFVDRGIGSNGWGIGGQMTENGRGALLANPHFPYTGSQRLYQSQVTVPGVYNVNGGTLIGVVIPLIGFNDNVAWTHTVSTAQHFTFYQLQLADGDNESFVKDGKVQPITSRTLTIQVANGSPTPTTLQKTFYYSDQGPMIAANLVNANLPAWGDNFPGQGQPVAFTYRDANLDTARQVIDQWIAMGRSRNVSDFQQPFRECGSVLWVNTMYADSSGQAFYIDGTSVPNLSSATLAALKQRAATNPIIGGLFQAGVTVLDGSTSRDDWVEGRCDGLVAYDGLPKLARRDFVQNSNDSYWATNPDEFLTGFSPLFGPTKSILSPRTRMGLRMLENPVDGGLSNLAPAGSDGLFTGQEIINNALYSNRAYYAETLLDNLLERCAAAGDTPIDIETDGDDSTDESRPVAGGCTALANWDGVYNIDSTGAHVFRVFIADYSPGFPDEFTVAFDPANPETTPSTPKDAPSDMSEDPMLQSLARGLDKLDRVNIAYDATLGDVQAEQQSAGVPPGGTPAPSGPLIPWHGNQNIEGGFNIVEPVISPVDEGTRFPRVTPTGPLPGTGRLSSTPGEGWRIARGTSWHFGMNFTDDGPRGFGLVSYSQSDDPSSEHFSDQDQRYSNKNYRNLLYSQKDIEADANLVTETISENLNNQ